MAQRDRSQHLANLYGALSKALRGGLSLVLFARLNEVYPKEAGVVRYFVDRFSPQEPLQWAAMLQRDKSFKDEYGAYTQSMALNLLERGAARIGVFDAATQELRSLHDELRRELLDLIPEAKSARDTFDSTARIEALESRIAESEKNAVNTANAVSRITAKAETLERAQRQASAMFQLIRAICAKSTSAPISRPLTEFTYELERGDETRVRVSVSRLLAHRSADASPSLISLVKSKVNEISAEFDTLTAKEAELRGESGRIDSLVAEMKGTLEQTRERHSSAQKSIQRLTKELTDLSLSENSTPDQLDAKSDAIKTAMTQRSELKGAIDAAETDLASTQTAREQIEREISALPDRREELNSLKTSLAQTILLLERKEGLVQFVDRIVPKATNVSDDATGATTHGFLTDDMRNDLRILSRTPTRFWGDKWTASAWGCMVNLKLFTDLADLFEAWIAGSFEDRIKAGGPLADTLGKRKVIGKIRALMTRFDKDWRKGGAYSQHKLGAFIAERMESIKQA